MGFLDTTRQRLAAAFDVFRTKTPQPRAVMQPMWSLFMSPSMGAPTANHQLSYQQLRAFSESAIPRRAINYIRDQVARLDYEFVTKPDVKLTREQKKRLEALKHILASPNVDDSFQSFIGQMIEDMLVIGWGVSEVKEYTGHPEQPYLLYPIDSASMQVYLDWDGNPNTRRYAQFDLHGNRVDFKPYQLLIFKQTPRSNTPFGLSPLEVAIQQIQYLLDAQVYAGRTASNAVPKKLLFMGKEVTEDQLRDFRGYFKGEIEGNSHLPIFGGTDGMESIELGNVGDQALFLEWQKFLIAIIADAFGLDVMKFNITVGINRSTGDTLDDVSDESAIRPMAHQIEHVINHRLLAYFGLSDLVEFRFLFTASYSDRKSLAIIHQIYANIEVLTINEMRRELGRPDLPIDEATGRSRGDMTLAEYRATYGGQVNLNDAVGIDNEFGTPGMLSIQKEQADAKNAQSQSKTNNGSAGSKQPDAKSTNQGSKAATKATL